MKHRDALIFLAEQVRLKNIPINSFVTYLFWLNQEQVSPDEIVRATKRQIWMKEYLAIKDVFNENYS